MPTTRDTVRGEWTNSMIMTVVLLANKTLKETEDIEEGARVQKKTFSARVSDTEAWCMIHKIWGGEGGLLKI